MNNIKVNQVEIPRLSQFKLFLKIIGISYILETTHTFTTADVIKKIIKENYIFNNVELVSRPRVIKISPKSNMLIMWIDIWDAQSGAKAKSLINWCFNIGSYTTTICGANINLKVPQYKNCWKWEYTTGVYKLQGVRYVKCNGLHKLEHHWHFTWCYKANEKTNLPRLETKKGKLCLHTFKCSNYKGDY